MNFPHHDLPHDVTTHVDVDRWSRQIEMMRDHSTLYSNVPIMVEVLKDLKEGCDSNVQYPGTVTTFSSNYFPVPAIDLPRITDALLSEVKAGHLAGPYDKGSIPNAKINGFMSEQA